MRTRLVDNGCLMKQPAISFPSTCLETFIHQRCPANANVLSAPGKTMLSCRRADRVITEGQLAKAHLGHLLALDLYRVDELLLPLAASCFARLSGNLAVRGSGSTMQLHSPRQNREVSERSINTTICQAGALSPIAMALSSRGLRLGWSPVKVCEDWPKRQQ